jgi:hypothetical protein
MLRLALGLALLAPLAAAPASARASSDGQPISLGLVTPIQIVPEAQGIGGFRFSLIYGNNAFVRGFDLGLVALTSGGVTGVQWGAVSIVGGNFTGWQGNWVVSMTGGSIEGLQTGLYNQANHVKGLQLGVVNHAVTMEGVQIGLVNIIQKGGMLPVFPFFNFSFK